VLFVIGIVINLAIFGLAIPLENGIGVNL